MKKLFLAAFASACLATPALAISTVDRIVAVVNNSVITQAELTQRVQNAQANLQRQNIEAPATEVLSRQVLDMMINEQLQLQYANNNGLRIGELELDQALQSIAQQNKTDLAGLRALLEKDGSSIAKLREQLRSDLLLERIKEREVNSRVNVTDQEVAQVQQTTTGLNRIEYRLAAIQVNIPERATPAQVEERRQKLLKAAAEIKAGKSFAQVAAAYSEASNALQGGDLGWRNASALPQDFIQLLDTLPVGGVTELVRASGSLYLFKLVDKRDTSGPQYVKQHKVRHILVKTNEATSDTDAYARILQVQDRIKRGAKFEDMARQFSEDGSASLGGDLGWVNEGDTVPDFERTFRQLQAKQVSEPVKTPFGWHLILLEDVRSQDVSTDREKLVVKQQIRQRKIEQSYIDWLEQLRASAFIEDRLVEK